MPRMPSVASVPTLFGRSLEASPSVMNVLLGLPPTGPDQRGAEVLVGPRVVEDHVRVGVTTGDLPASVL